MTGRKRFWTLFSAMFTISAFTFGGGFVIVTLMKKKFTDELGWVSEEEMLDMTALAQSSPGAIAVNAAILMGWRTGGFFGMLAAVAGTVLPPVMILSLVSVFYSAFAANRWAALLLRGMQGGVAAVIFDAAISLGGGILRQKKPLGIFIMAGAFAASLVFEVNAVFIILAAALLGAGAAFMGKRGGAE